MVYRGAKPRIRLELRSRTEAVRASPYCVLASGRPIAAARAIDFTASVNDSTPHCLLVDGAARVDDFGPRM